MVAMVPIKELIKSWQINGSTIAYPLIHESVTIKKRQSVNTKDAAAITIAQSRLNNPLHSLMYLRVNTK
jgi:hypothetical protein